MWLQSVCDQKISDTDCTAFVAFTIGDTNFLLGSEKFPTFILSPLLYAGCCKTGNALLAYQEEQQIDHQNREIHLVNFKCPDTEQY